MILSNEDLRARACAELRRGAPIVLTLGEEAALVLAAEMATQSMIDRVAATASPTTQTNATSPRSPIMAVTARRANVLKARAYDSDIARIRLRGAPTETLIRAIADPAQDLDAPLLGPHRTLRSDGEDSGAPSAEMARAAVELCRRAKLLPAPAIWRLGSRSEADDLALRERLVILEAPPPRTEEAGEWIESISARVPIAAFPNTRMRLFRRVGWDDEHYALEMGDPRRDRPVLTRLHSACATGDLFSSLKCDCGPQLHAALRRIAAEGAGVLVYLQQEGRGIGLANKLRAYRLQDQGFDTVDANHRLGFRDDERLLAEGGEILRAMGFRQARLMTNNPK